MRGLRIVSGLAAAYAAAAPLAAQTWRTVTSARQLQGERELRVDVNYAAGRFSLAPAAGGTLYRMELRYDEDKFIPVRTYDAAAGTLRLGVRSRQGVRVRMSDRRGEQPPSLDVALSDAIPLLLNLELGAAQADVELGGLSLRAIRYRTGASETDLRFSSPNPLECDVLEMEAGAAAFSARQIANANCARVVFNGGVGEVTLDFTGTWRRSMQADVNVGIGTLNLRLPRDVGVELQLSRFLASFDRAGFTRRGNTWVSSNFDTARTRLSLTVDAAIGGVGVEWVGR